MNKIEKTISKKEWNSLISNYTVKDICLSLSFDKAMQLVKNLFYDDIQDDEKQQYALRLAYEIKDHFSDTWEKDWKNEIFLGDLCVMLWLYDERYECYKKAYDKLKDPPEELLLLLSNCNRAPGNPPISNEESEFYLREALKKNLTCEVAQAMKNYFKIKKNKFQEDYWNQMYKNLAVRNVHSNHIIPDVFKKINSINI